MYNQDEWPALPKSNNGHNTSTEVLQLRCKAMKETAADQKKEIEHLSQLVKTQHHHINAIQEQQQQEQQKTITNLQQDIQQLATDQQWQANETREQQKEVLY